MGFSSEARLPFNFLLDSLSLSDVSFTPHFCIIMILVELAKLELQFPVLRVIYLIFKKLEQLDVHLGLNTRGHNLTARAILHDAF